MNFVNFFIVMTVFLGLDFVWLNLIAKNFYQRELSGFSFSLSFFPAVATYILICLGIIVFVMPKAINGNLFSAFLTGSLYGLIVYGVYDLTNLATLAKWSVKMTIVDMAWGAFVCGATVLIAKLIIGTITK